MVRDVRRGLSDATRRGLLTAVAQQQRKRKARRVINPAEPFKWQWVAASYLEGYRVLWDTDDWNYKTGGNAAFPLYTLLRQAIELYLKWALATADRMRKGSSLPDKEDGLQGGHNLVVLGKALEQRARGVITKPLWALITKIQILDPRGDAVRYPTDKAFNEWSKGVDVMDGGHQEVICIVDDGRDLIEVIRTLPQRTKEALRAMPVRIRRVP